MTMTKNEKVVFAVESILNREVAPSELPPDWRLLRDIYHAGLRAGCESAVALLNLKHRFTIELDTADVMGEDHEFIWCEEDSNE